MEFLKGFLFIGLIFSGLSCVALDMSSCHTRCFEAKRACNSSQSHTFNSCQRSLDACRMSCNGGKPHGFYHPNPLINVQLKH